jgi:NADH-quinone oxidoreductase subunit N
MMWNKKLKNKILSFIDKPYHLVVASVLAVNESEKSDVIASSKVYWETNKEFIKHKLPSFVSQTYKNAEAFWWSSVGNTLEYPYFVGELFYFIIFVILVVFISIYNLKDRSGMRKYYRKQYLNTITHIGAVFISFAGLISSYVYYFAALNLKESTVKNFYLRANSKRDFQIRNNVLADYKEAWLSDGSVSDFFSDMDYSISKLFFSRLVIIDHFGLFMKAFLCLCVFFLFFVVQLEIWKNFYGKAFNSKNRFDLNFMLVSSLAIFFLLSLINSYDLLSLFVALEGSTLCLYVLAGLRNKQRLSVEAGLKYFLTSAVFSCIFGFGAYLLYFITGSTNFSIIREVISHIVESTSSSSFLVSFYNLDYVLLFAVFLIIVVFLMKLASAPYHFWIGDVYQGAPLIVTAFFSTIVRVSFFAIFFRLIMHVFYFMNASAWFVSLLFFAGCFSIIFGSVLALNQFEVKRFLANSSIVHTGFILISLSTMTIDGFKCAFLYTVVYIFTLLCFFLLIYIYPVQTVQNQKGVLIHNQYKVKYFSDLQNLSMPVQLMFIFFLFSMAGLPPFPGFIIKLYVFKVYLGDFIMDFFSYFSLLNYNTFFEFANFYIFVIVVLASLLTAFNYTRLITKMSFTTSKNTSYDKFLFGPRAVQLRNISSANKAIVVVVIIINLILINKLSSFYVSESLDSVISSCYHPFLNGEVLAVEHFITVESDSPIRSLELWFRALPYDPELNPGNDDHTYIKDVRWVSGDRFKPEIDTFNIFN